MLSENSGCTGPGAVSGPGRVFSARARLEDPRGACSANEAIGVAMAAKAIISYDGTANDQDALALGRFLADMGVTLQLAYVRHAVEAEREREQLEEHEAQT